MKQLSSGYHPRLVLAGAFLFATIGLVGAGYGYRALQQARELANTPPPAPSPMPADHTAAEVQRLQLLLRETENAYNEARNQLANLQSDDAVRTETNVDLANGAISVTATGASADTSRESYMERLQREDPERYQQIQESRAARRQEIEARWQEQLTRLQQRRQQARSPEEIALLDQMESNMQQMYDLGQRWRELRELPADDRSAAMPQLMQESAAIYTSYRQLREQDRQLQLNQLATDAGYTDPKQIADFTKAIEQIYQDTSSNPFRTFGDGGRRGRRGSQ